MAVSLETKLDDRGTLVLFSTDAKVIAHLQSVHTGSADNPASYPIGSMSSPRS
jgi:hypothetical protein